MAGLLDLMWYGGTELPQHLSGKVTGWLGSQYDRYAPKPVKDAVSAYLDTNDPNIDRVIEEGAQSMGPFGSMLGAAALTPRMLKRAHDAATAAKVVKGAGKVGTKVDDAVRGAKGLLSAADAAAPAVHTKGLLSWVPGMPLADIDPTRLNIPKAGRSLTVEDVGKYIESQSSKKLGAVPHGASYDAKFNRAMEQSVPEFRDQLAQPNPNLDFYSVDTPNSDAMLAERFPELAQDPVKHSLQKVFSAIMSNNSTPDAEAFNGARIWELYRNNPGQIPLLQPNGKNWPAQGAADQIKKVQLMLNDLGERGVYDFLSSPQTVADIRRYRPSMEGKASAVVPGTEVLGNKIGHYFDDLRGRAATDGHTTVDKWDMRRSSRQRGLLFDGSKLIETPRTAVDRQVNMDTHKALADMFNIPAARDAQSGQWHYEQDLWRRMGLPVKSTKRSDGVRRYLGLLDQ